MRAILDLGIYGKIPEDTLHHFLVDMKDGSSLTLYQTKHARTLGSWVYDGAFVLTRYLEHLHCDDRSPFTFTKKKVIELGAGTGIVGLIAAHYGALAHITELPNLVPLLAYNISKNAGAISASGEAIAREYVWGESQSQEEFDYIFIANCVYYESGHGPLLKALAELCKQHTIVYGCYEIRCPEIMAMVQRWEEMASAKFHFEWLDFSDSMKDSSFELDEDLNVTIFTMKLKATSQR